METPQQGASVGQSVANLEHSEDSWKIVTDEPMPEVSLTSKRVRELKETDKNDEKIEKKEKERL